MANVKISELPNTTLPLSGSEQVAVVQNSETRKTTVLNILDTTTPRVVFNTASPGTLAEGVARWNATIKTVEVGAGNVTLQLGFEQLKWVKNTTVGQLDNGKVVGFTGGDLSTKLPTAAHYIADGSFLGIQLIGVATENIAAGSTGRICTEGEVHDINTTGASVSETWVAGDILYAHPTIAGALTKVKPTPPNISVPVAAVTYAHSTDGVLLVRPTVNQRLYYGEFSDSTQQTQAGVNTPKAVTFNTTRITSGITIGSPTSRIVFANSGAYNLRLTAQIKKTTTGIDNIWVWLRKNGSDVSGSGSKIELPSNGYTLSTWTFPVTPSANDYYELMWAVDDTSITLEPLASQVSPFTMPACPSVSLSIHQVNH